jgi:hypothetical protein
LCTGTTIDTIGFILSGCFISTSATTEKPVEAGELRNNRSGAISILPDDAQLATT